VQCVIDVGQVLTGLEANVDHGSDDLDDLSDVLGHELVMRLWKGCYPGFAAAKVSGAYRRRKGC
jgi:hypothetical protein